MPMQNVRRRTDTFITVTTNIIKVVFTITAMLAIEWRLTLVGVLVLPLFILPGRRVACTETAWRRAWGFPPLWLTSVSLPCVVA